MKSFDVVSLGELLIDFTKNGVSAREIQYWRPIRAERRAMFWQC
ncbi:MAG: hypothetical protein V8R80_02865 [Eubacterium sp.]